jgi:hypothetical protein
VTVNRRAAGLGSEGAPEPTSGVSGGSELEGVSVDLGDFDTDMEL